MSFLKGPGFVHDLAGGGTVDAAAVQAALADDPEGARTSLEDPDGTFPLNSFTLTDHTDSILPEGAYAEDALNNLRRHDNVTTGGVQVFPSRYSGFAVVDYTGKGGSGAGSIDLLETLQSIISSGFGTGDSIRIHGTTSFQLDPADLPNATPAFQGYSFGNQAGGPSSDFWDLSGSAGTNVYQDIRHWSMVWTFNGTTWAPAAVNCLAVQQVTTAAGGSAITKTDGLTSALGANPQPVVSAIGSSFLVSVPLYWTLLDLGTPFTTGLARIRWDLVIEVDQS